MGRLGAVRSVAGSTLTASTRLTHWEISQVSAVGATHISRCLAARSPGEDRRDPVRALLAPELRSDRFGEAHRGFDLHATDRDALDVDAERDVECAAVRDQFGGR